MKLPNPEEITTDWISDQSAVLDDALNSFYQLWDDVNNGDVTPQQAVDRVKLIFQPLQIS
jgi:hypothetical protein